MFPLFLTLCAKTLMFQPPPASGIEFWDFHKPRNGRKFPSMNAPVKMQAARRGNALTSCFPRYFAIANAATCVGTVKKWFASAPPLDAKYRSRGQWFFRMEVQMLQRLMRQDGYSR